MFDAVAIEYAFDNLLGRSVGARGGANDADVFRNGSPTYLAEVIEAMVVALRKRTSTIPFDAADRENGGAEARLGVSISRLAELGKVLAKRKVDEPDDYHWEIIGALVMIISSLLEHIEKGAATR